MSPQRRSFPVLPLSSLQARHLGLEACPGLGFGLCGCRLVLCRRGRHRRCVDHGVGPGPPPLCPVCVQP
eukprot:scaffold7059_cov250-Pinguiococcus_pyrenoidosus.AAC.22